MEETKKPARRPNLSEAELEDLAKICLEMSDNTQKEVKIGKKVGAGDLRWLIQYLPTHQKKLRQMFSHFSFINLENGVVRITRKKRR